MKKPMTFKELAKKVLAENPKPLSVDEIWNQANELGYVGTIFVSSGITPFKSLQSQIYTDINKKGDESDFKQVSNRPALFGLRTKDYGDIESLVEEKMIEQEEESGKKENNQFERQLHEVLTAYAIGDNNFHCHTHTIYHEKSVKKRKGFERWIHPDIVGVRMPSADYKAETLNLLKPLSINMCKFFSFEMKLELNTMNLRESFFQAVSNSSWANEGYLVAAKYESGLEFENEMRMLNSAFGIGFIKLDIQNFDHKIILAARVNDKLDWKMMERLYESNPDFRNFTETIKECLELKRENANVTISNKFDKVYSEEELQERTKNIQI